MIRAGFVAAAAAIGAILLFPVLILAIETPPSAWVQSLHDPVTHRAIATTLGSGILALLAVMGLGVPMAVYLGRFAGPRVRAAGGVLLTVPLLIPPLVLGLVLAAVLAPTAAIGQWLAQWGISGTNSWFSLIVAEIYEALPYFVMALWGYLAAIPRQTEEDAYVLGRFPLDTLVYVVWPAARPGLLAATTLAWSRITGAFGAPVVVAYHPTGLPVAIWIRLEEYGLPAALALAAWLVIISLPLPLWFQWRVFRADRRD